MSDQCDPWLRGLDLFERQHYWESHEAWEELWQASEKGSPEGLLLRGLIQAAAACLKSQQGNPRGVAILRARAAHTLRASGISQYRELDIQRLIEDLDLLQTGQLLRLAGFPRERPNPSE